MSDPKTSLIWGKGLDRFDRADVTVAQFCLQEGVSQSPFYHLRRRLHCKSSHAEQDQPLPIARFVPVSLAMPPTASAPAPAPPTATLPLLMTVELPRGIRIRLEIPADHPQADQPEARP